MAVFILLLRLVVPLGALAVLGVAVVVGGEQGIGFAGFIALVTVFLSFHLRFEFTDADPRLREGKLEVEQGGARDNATGDQTSAPAKPRNTP